MSFLPPLTLLQEQKAVDRILGMDSPLRASTPAQADDMAVQRLLGLQETTRARAQAQAPAHTSTRPRAGARFQRALRGLRETSRYDNMSRGELIQENRHLRREVAAKDRTIQALRQTSAWDQALTRQRVLPESMDNRPPRRRSAPRTPTPPPEPPRPRAPRTDRELIEQIRQADTASPRAPSRFGVPPQSSSSGPAPLTGPTPGDLTDKPTRWETLDCDPFGMPLPPSEAPGHPRFEDPEVNGSMASTPREPQPSPRFEDIGGNIAALIESSAPLEE